MLNNISSRVLVLVWIGLWSMLIATVGVASSVNAQDTCVSETVQYYVGPSEGCIIEVRVGSGPTLVRGERGASVMVSVPTEDVSRVRTRYLCIEPR